MEDLATCCSHFARSTPVADARTGLGLVICRRLAVLLGGISVTSEWAPGIVFTVSLPINSELENEPHDFID